MLGALLNRMVIAQINKTGEKIASPNMAPMISRNRLVPSELRIIEKGLVVILPTDALKPDCMNLYLLDISDSR